MDHPIKNILNGGQRRVLRNYINLLDKYLNIEEPQLYFPIMSLFFYIHNTKIT